MRTGFKNILLATDLSPNAHKVFQFAAVEALRHDAKLVILYVIAQSSENMEGIVSGLFGEEKWRDIQNEKTRFAKETILGKKPDYDLVKEALQNIAKAGDRAPHAVEFEDAEVVVADGNPATNILKVAKEKNCELIIMGAHKGLVGSTTFGSVAKAVVRETNIPVLLIPPG